MPKSELWSSLRNKVAIVTGAGRGIGKAIAVAFARADAKVAVIDRDPAKMTEAVNEIKEYSRWVIGLKTDVSIKEEVDSMVNQVLEKFGTVDILVNNAGRDIQVPLMQMREDGWNKTFDVNVKSCYLCTQSAGNIMMQKHGGSIINMASMSGILADKSQGAYCASKAAVIQLTRAFAAELASHNIRVNCVLPGIVKSRMSQLIHTNVEYRKHYEHEVIPLGRMAEPEDIAGPVLFLASDASAYITGAALMVDGGVTLTGYNKDIQENVLGIK